MIEATQWQPLAAFLRTHPAVWPAALFPVCLLGFWGLARSGSAHAYFKRVEPRVLAVGGALCLGLFVLSAGLYLAGGVFHDAFEGTQASVSSLMLRGGAVYTGLHTEERYSTPYGPVLYLALGVSQWLFGPSVFSTKLPGAAAAWLSVALFWHLVYRRRGPAAAFALAGLEAALLATFRHNAFGAKPDPLILLCVTGGLCAVQRPGWARVALLGVCLGCAVDLKPHAAAYFLPLFVVACGAGWPPQMLAMGAAVGVGTALLPFLAAPAQFSLPDYLNFLSVTAHEGFAWHAAFGFCKWVGLLAALIYVGEKLTGRTGASAAEDERARQLRVGYRAALALGSLLVATPAAMVGADQHHLLPFVPLVLLAVGDQFAARKLCAGACLRRTSTTLLWRAAAYAAFAACALTDAQTLWRVVRENALRGEHAAAYLAEMRQVLATHPRATVLMGAGDTIQRTATYFRQEAVFAGNPVGIDIASAMDYQRGGVPEPNLARLVAEINGRHPHPVWWVFPRGAAPFTATNFYDDARPAYSETFRRDFHAQFEKVEQTRFFDLYAVRSPGAAPANQSPPAAVLLAQGKPTAPPAPGAAPEDESSLYADDDPYYPYYYW